MRRIAAILVVVGLGLTFCTLVSGDDKKDGPKPKGQLPQNWRKLGLDDSQVTKIYSIQAEYRGKIQPLEKQIADLKEKQLSEMQAVLTTAQKARLREILSGKGPKDNEPTKEKKPEKEKSSDNKK